MPVPYPEPGLRLSVVVVVVAAGWPDVWLVVVACIALLVLTALGAVYAWHLRAKSLEHKHRRRMFEVRVAGWQVEVTSRASSE